MNVKNNEIRKVMHKLNYKTADLAKLLGKSRKTISLKLNYKYPWTYDEVVTMRKIFNLNNKTFMYIFFDDKNA